MNTHLPRKSESARKRTCSWVRCVHMCAYVCIRVHMCAYVCICVHVHPPPLTGKRQRDPHLQREKQVGGLRVQGQQLLRDFLAKYLQKHKWVKCIGVRVCIMSRIPAGTHMYKVGHNHTHTHTQTYIRVTYSILGR